MHPSGEFELGNPRALAPDYESPLRRRGLLQGGLALAVLSAFGCRHPLISTPPPSSTLLGFNAVAISNDDIVHVPAGYRATVLWRWGDPTGSRDGEPAFRTDASNSAEEQMLQAGMHHDGMHFFPLPRDSESSTHGLLVINHEYTDDGLLHPGGMKTWTAEKVRKSQAAHGVSVIEIELVTWIWLTSLALEQD